MASLLRRSHVLCAGQRMRSLADSAHIFVAKKSVEFDYVAIDIPSMIAPALRLAKNIQSEPRRHREVCRLVVHNIQQLLRKLTCRKSLLLAMDGAEALSKAHLMRGGLSSRRAESRLMRLPGMPLTQCVEDRIVRMMPERDCMPAEVVFSGTSVFGCVEEKITAWSLDLACRDSLKSSCGSLCLVGSSELYLNSLALTPYYDVQNLLQGHAEMREVRLVDILSALRLDGFAKAGQSALVTRARTDLLFLYLLCHGCGCTEMLPNPSFSFDHLLDRYHAMFLSTASNTHGTNCASETVGGARGAGDVVKDGSSGESIPTITPGRTHLFRDGKAGQLELDLGMFYALLTTTTSHTVNVVKSMLVDSYLEHLLQSHAMLCLGYTPHPFLIPQYLELRCNLHSASSASSPPSSAPTSAAATTTTSGKLSDSKESPVAAWTSSVRMPSAAELAAHVRYLVEVASSEAASLPARPESSNTWPEKPNSGPCGASLVVVRYAEGTNSQTIGRTAATPEDDSVVSSCTLSRSLDDRTMASRSSSIDFSAPSRLPPNKPSASFASPAVSSSVLHSPANERSSTSHNTTTQREDTSEAPQGNKDTALHVPYDAFWHPNQPLTAAEYTLLCLNAPAVVCDLLQLYVGGNLRPHVAKFITHADTPTAHARIQDTLSYANPTDPHPSLCLAPSYCWMRHEKSKLWRMSYVDVGQRARMSEIRRRRGNLGGVSMSLTASQEGACMFDHCAGRWVTVERFPYLASADGALTDSSTENGGTSRAKAEQPCVSHPVSGQATAVSEAHSPSGDNGSSSSTHESVGARYNDRLLKVLTWNVMFDRYSGQATPLGMPGIDWCSPQRYPVLARCMQRECADVIAMQEVEPVFLDYLSRQPWCRAHYILSCSLQSAVISPWGVCMLIHRRRFDVMQLTHVNIPAWPGHLSLMPIATLRFPAAGMAGVHVSAIHLLAPFTKNRENSRTAQDDVLRQRLSRGVTGDCIAMGDFNDWPSNEFCMPVNSNYAEVWPLLHPNNPGKTMDESNTFCRLKIEETFFGRSDKVFVRSHRIRPMEAHLVGTRSVNDENGNTDAPSYLFPSDHYGVSVTFKIS